MYKDKGKIPITNNNNSITTIYDKEYKGILYYKL